MRLLHNREHQTDHKSQNIKHHQRQRTTESTNNQTMMFSVLAHRTAFAGRQAIARSFAASVGSQVPSVDLHS